MKLKNSGLRLSSLVVATASVLIAQSAFARTQCTVATPSNSAYPNNYDKPLLNWDVKPSPSANPMDPTRHTSVLVSADRSTAREISAEELGERRANKRYGDIDGALLIDTQEVTDPAGTYAVYIEQIDGKSGSVNEIAQSWGGVRQGSDLVVISKISAVAVGCTFR